MTFSDFWTNQNNPALPRSEYLYGTRHIIMLVATVVLCIVLSLIFYRRSDKAKKILFIVFASTFLFLETLSRIVNLVIETDYTWQSILKIILPMHICSVMVWMFIISIFTNNNILKCFAVIGGILATLAFLLYPAVGINRVHFSFTCIYSTASHVLGFVCSILMIVLGYVKFEFKKIWWTYVCFAIMFAWGALLNFVIFPGSDYMYMINDPLELTLPFPYQILYVVLIAIYIFAFYFVSFLVDYIKNRKVRQFTKEI